jgi:hypothetical protein
MISAVTGTANVYANTTVPTGNRTGTNTSSQMTGGTQDSVELSSTAQAQVNGLTAALKEASETPAQTAKEAQHGDLQAKHLLAKEAQAQNSSSIKNS